jgi:hypothetical protein
VKLEILVSRVAPDEGMIVDENQKQWDMVEIQHDESGEPYWQIETKVKDSLIQGIYDDVAISVSSWTDISGYMQQ